VGQWWHLIISDDVEKGNDIRTTAENLKDLYLSFDFLLFDGFEDFDDTFLLICGVYSFEYFRVLSSADFSDDLVVLRVPTISDVKISQPPCYLQII
jgi:hypothetical protein